MLKANQCRTPETPKSFRTLPILKIVLNKILSSPENNNLKSDKSDTEDVKMKSITFY